MNSSDEGLPKIRVIRGVRVVVDADLAARFEVPTKRLNEAVRRNPEKFPDEFTFLVDEKNLATSSSHGGRRNLPRVFTEHGARPERP
jgi:hypothetical protein